MKKLFLCVSYLILTAASVPAINLSLSTSSMAWTNQTWLGVSVTDIAVEAGIDLQLYVDIDGNGSVDGDDFLVAVFEVDDGEQNPFGAESLVDDNDGIANGATESSIAMFGNAYNFLHTIGTYVWKAVEIDESDAIVGSATAPFEITQSSGGSWVTGQVLEPFLGEPIPGALVELEFFSDTAGAAPSAWADTNGVYTLQLPPGISTNAPGFIAASARGMFSIEYHPETFVALSGRQFTNSLLPGENVMSNLYVVADDATNGQTNDLYTVQGTVNVVEDLGGGLYETFPIGGVLVIHEDDSDPESWSFDFTDTNGTFSLVIPSDDWDAREVECDSSLLSLRGLVGTLTNLVVTGTVSGVEINLDLADSMIQGRVEAEGSGAPLGGVEVFFEGSGGSLGSTFSATNGVYEIVLQGGETYQGGCESDTLAPVSYIAPPWTNGLAVSEGSVLSNINFVAERGYLVTGFVTDTNGTPLTYGSVAVLEDRGYEHWIGDSDMRLDGYYALLAPTGAVYVRTEEFGEYYIDRYHSNQTLCAISDIDPLMMTTGGLTGVNFSLPTGARLEGSVLCDGGGSYTWQRVSVLVPGAGPGEWTCIGGGNTDDSGWFGFSVPATSEAYLRTELAYSCSGPRTWYGDTCSGDTAMSLSVDNGVTTSNLNITVSPGFQAGGDVQEQGAAFISGAEVTAYDSFSNRYDSATTDGNGQYYNLYLPTGIVLYVYADADGYAGEFYQDAYTTAAAQSFETVPAYTHQYTPFTLYATSTDSDDDGLADYLEDSVPDNTYNAGDDYADLSVKDTDGDGAEDGDEYIAGTAPQDSNSLFQIVAGDISANQFWVTWSSVAGRQYNVTLSTDLVSGGWSNVYSVTASGPLTSCTNALPTDTGYLRVEVSSD